MKIFGAICSTNHAYIIFFSFNPQASSCLTLFPLIYRNLIKFMKARGEKNNFLFIGLEVAWWHENVWIWHIYLSTLHSFMIFIDPFQFISHRWFHIYRVTWLINRDLPYFFIFQSFSVSIEWHKKIMNRKISSWKLNFTSCMFIT